MVPRLVHPTGLSRLLRLKINFKPQVRINNLSRTVGSRCSWPRTTCLYVSSELLHDFIEACYVDNETLEAAADLAVVAESLGRSATDVILRSCHPDPGPLATVLETSPFGICRMPASTSSPGSVPVGTPFTWAAPAPWAHPTPPQMPLGRLCSRPRPLGG